MKIFLTGGTGSLGRAILDRATQKQWGPEFTVYSRDEFKQGELRKAYPQHRYILGDIRDQEWLELAMKGHDLVIHTAAYKHVPQAEMNVAEAIDINIFGSLNLARTAVKLGIPKVVGISSDKACAPINTYGITKAAMEKIFSHACTWGETNFVCVRYGNVLGSRGSVLPVFINQLRTNGHVTLTDGNMTRFWLLMSEAVNLVERAIQEKAEGVVLVPKANACTMFCFTEAITRAMRIVTTEERHAPEIIGIRPGERYHEKLVHAGEAMRTEDSEDGFRIWPAYGGRIGNLPHDYEYTSDKAPQISLPAMQNMIERVMENAEEG